MEHNTSEEAAVQSNDSMLMNLYSLFLCPHFPLKSVYVHMHSTCRYAHIINGIIFIEPQYVGKKDTHKSVYRYVLC